MSKLSIKAENISKQYRLGQVGTGTISHDLNRFWSKIRGKEDPYLTIGEENDRASKGTNDYVWSLKDINFEIKQGDAVGIIGRNGAGKSTLLKLLSKVTKPTTGSFKVNGRIASLLEVGTGFNPEMTGRENIYLNGAILGMRKEEINRKFDEIVDFSGVERYIDTPVKRYSSGMYVRLAFAVAAHLESEILIVDEVLAVGDADFQRKCLGKMGDISDKEGRTVLFVSHNMGAVKTLCNNGILLNKGQIETIGNVDQCVNIYLNGGTEKKINSYDFDTIGLKNIFKLLKISVQGTNDSNKELLYDNEEIKINTEILIYSDEFTKYHLTYHLLNEFGETLFSFTHLGLVPLKKGMNILTCVFPKSFFQSGNFFLSLFIVYDKRTLVFVEKSIFSFNIVNGNKELGEFMGREPGFIRPVFNWINS
ncbi:ABC transporter ATP-binding protein [Flavobacterium sp.]|uniref:ABC transporter ATP-binding protein n=1 Tax=Flavobacterium sp. TaxID=239 RepID=UPI003753A885